MLVGSSVFPGNEPVYSYSSLASNLRTATRKQKFIADGRAYQSAREARSHCWVPVQWQMSRADTWCSTLTSPRHNTDKAGKSLELPPVVLLRA